MKPSFHKLLCLLAGVAVTGGLSMPGWSAPQPALEVAQTSPSPAPSPAPASSPPPVAETWSGSGFRIQSSQPLLKTLCDPTVKSGNYTISALGRSYTGSLFLSAPDTTLQAVGCASGSPTQTIVSTYYEETIGKPPNATEWCWGRLRITVNKNGTGQVEWLTTNPVVSGGRTYRCSTAGQTANVSIRRQ